jgi:cytochrome c553
LPGRPVVDWRIALVKTIVHLAAAFGILFMDWITGATRTEPVRYGPVVRLVTKHPWMTAAALATALGLAAATLVVSGVVSIRASSGHWPVTAWLLDFAKVQSVKTYSLGVDPPPLDDAARVLRGAAHYAVACEPCHGSPDIDVPAVMGAMTPPPPPLTGEHVTRWTPAQLFSIVKHGIKFTGMPAWPVQQRDDEVWATVAFLARLPRTNGDEYRTMVGRSPTTDAATTPVPTAGAFEPPAPVRTVCWRCHGVDGTGRDGAFPSLAGQRAAYLNDALKAFADGARFSATMADVATKLDESARRAIAEYYAQLPSGEGAPAGDAETIARGATIAAQGIPDRDVPACVECHGPSDAPKNPAYPTLAGQHASYLGQQLELLRQRRRGGSPRVNLMHAVVDRLTPEDIRQVTSYYASIAPEER